MNCKYHRVIYWTDSAVVIRYLRNTSRRFQTFVDNRLQTIYDASSPSQWRHVPTELNPADVASQDMRTMRTMAMRTMTMWALVKLWQPFVKKYWIVRGPSTVRRILNKCIPCRRRCDHPPTQIMAPLPRARVSPGMPPFSAVGVD